MLSDVWGDLLTGYNGKTVTSDAIGNITSDGTRTYTWEHGRELASLTKDGVTWTFTYDANGMRTGRTDGTNTYEYVYDGDKLMQMTKNGEVIRFTYVGDIPMTMTYDGETYYYVVNGQGDVTGLTDSTGKLVIGYLHNGWRTSFYTLEDSELSPILFNINPLIYRGYVFDRETGLYYVSSRYYDPEISRFINADVFASTGQGLLGNNMFAYCLNNPANRTDIGGTISVDCYSDDVELFDRLLEGSSGGGDGGAISNVIAGTAGLLSTWMLGGAIAAPNKPMSSSRVDEKEEARAIAISTTSNSEAVYYGIDLYGGYMKYTTGPMSFQEADAWATLTAASNTYAPRASWGLYTQNQADALAMAIWLGYYDGPVRLDPAKSSKYLPHFHVSDKTIHGIPAPNFHIWFGGQ